MNMPNLFLLDDSKEIQGAVVSMAKRCEWDVVPARCLSEAEEIWKHKPDFLPDAAMIDLMIPRLKVDLDRVDSLLEQRIQHSLLLTRRARTDDDKTKHENSKMLLEQIDKQIMPLICDDGGIQFLGSHTGKRVANLLGPKLAIFSARRPNTVPTGKDDDLRTMVSIEINRTDFEWFEKPVPIPDLEDWLTKIASKG